MNAPRKHLEIGILLVSLAVLLIELLLTRIFSVTMFYHLSFMVVSLAMLGFGASGLVVNLWPGLFPAERAPQRLALASLALGVSAIVSVGIAFHLPVSLEFTAFNWVKLAVIFLLCTIPFLAGGLVVALILTLHAEHSNRLYFFDLVGASLGCLAFIPATNWLGAPTAILVAAAVAAIAGAVLTGGADPKMRRIALVAAGLFSVLAALNGPLDFYDVKFIKGKEQPPMLALRWNSFSRVEVIGTPASLWNHHRPVYAGFSSTLDPEVMIPEVWLRYDADAATQITRFNGDLTRLQHLRFDVTSTAYQLRTYKDVLIIGPGGGRDVLTALSMGSGPVTGVEINPITVELMRSRFRTFTGGLYVDYPGVHIINDEGRSFLRRDPGLHELIQASVVDTWAASSAGAYALTENNLYTVEAFGDYLTHLTPDGVISFTRWFNDPPVESLRLVSLAKEALARQGSAHPEAHFFVVRTDPDKTHLPSLGSILIKRSPFTEAEIVKLRQWTDAMGFLVMYAPQSEPKTDFHRVLGPDSATFIRDFPFDITPVHDDRPFFFNRVPILPWIAQKLGLSSGNSREAPMLTLGGQTLFLSLVITGVCMVLLLVVPLVAARRKRMIKDNRVSRGRSLVWALYFAGLGLGFIMVEVVLIQRFSLFLGYPVYSLAAVLFTMLLASGLGSLVSGRFHGDRTWVGMLGLLCFVVLPIYSIALPIILDHALRWSTPGRIALAVALVAPVGFLMGMPFPSGIRRAGGEASTLVSWAWAVNGGASVFGSTFTVLVSMSYGFSASFLVGATSYALALVAAAAVWRGRARRSEERQIESGALAKGVAQ